MRILLRLRKELTDLLSAGRGEGAGGRTKNKEKAVRSGIVSEHVQRAKVVEHSKMKERSGNAYENKVPAFRNPERSVNVIENKASYAKYARMLVKRRVLLKMQGYTRQASGQELHPHLMVDARRSSQLRRVAPEKRPSHKR